MMENNDKLHKSESQIFREDVLVANQTNWLGGVVLISPLSFKLMAIFGICTFISVVIFGYFGTYTKRAEVTGQIVPEGGIVRVFPQQAGIVLDVRVKEGRHVSRGDVLFVMTSDKTSTVGESQQQISNSIRKRQALLSEEVNRVQVIAKHDRASLVTRVNSVRNQITTIDSMIIIQSNRIKVAADLAERYRKLLAEQFVSEADVQAREAELLDQKSRLKSLERDKSDAVGKLAELNAELAELPSKTETNIGSVQNQIQSAGEDLSNSESRRELTLKSPVSGIVTTIIGHVGQVVDTDQPLLSILPDGRKMKAELYANSKEIGFVHVGDEVDMRYEAYPYQMYGVYIGHVAVISRTPLSPEEFKYIGELIVQRSTPTDRGSPLYRISVNLDSQNVVVKGKQEPLRAGMLLEADIIQETRKLYKWVLEPLYAYLNTPNHKLTKDLDTSTK